MGENSKIEWTHHTFNPWWGCVKVSPGCEHCYAETFSKRVGQHIWGPAKTTHRRLFGDKHWAEPLKWNKAAEAIGERHRVFCASMADVFEDHPQVASERNRLFELIAVTPWLDWLLLTKRPENVNSMVHEIVGPVRLSIEDLDNVWIGTSVENQDAADKRIPELLKIPAKVRFLSCEPLLGSVDLTRWLCHWSGVHEQWLPFVPELQSIHWVIAGGESGPKARPMHPQWARSLRDQCQSAGVPFLFKQWGEWVSPEQFDSSGYDDGIMNDKALAIWPNGKTSPRSIAYCTVLDGHEVLWRVGKKTAGRLLDGREWNEFPTANTEESR